MVLPLSCSGLNGSTFIQGFKMCKQDQPSKEERANSIGLLPPLLRETPSCPAEAAHPVSQIHLHPSFLLLPFSPCTSTEGFCPFLQGLELSQVLKRAEASSLRSSRASERSTMPTRARYGCFWRPDLEQGRSSQNLFSS